MSDLQYIQENFQNYILGKSSKINKELLSPPQGNLEARLDVYGHGYFLRLQEALAEDFRALHRYLGGAMFNDLTQQYIRATPSETYTVNIYGRKLANFLKQQSPFNRKLFLAELAMFEWTLSEVSMEKTEPALGVATLGQVPIEQWPELCFRLQPSLHLCSFEYDIIELHKKIMAEADNSEQRLKIIPQKIAENSWAVVWQKDFQPCSRAIEKAEAQCLRIALVGGNFMRLAEELCQFHTEDEAPTVLVNYLRSWMELGWVVEYRIVSQGDG